MNTYLPEAHPATQFVVPHTNIPIPIPMVFMIGTAVALPGKMRDSQWSACTESRKKGEIQKFLNRAHLRSA